MSRVPKKSVRGMENWIEYAKAFSSLRLALGIIAQQPTWDRNFEQTNDAVMIQKMAELTEPQKLEMILQSPLAISFIENPNYKMKHLHEIKWVL